jgi:flagellar motility protein MotE (MotC chaperone)
MKHRRAIPVVASLLVLALASPGAAIAAEVLVAAENEATHATAKEAAPELPKPVKTEGSDAEQFCANIQDQARERRYALKQAELTAMAARIDEKMKALEAKRAEFEAWQTRREEFAALATDNLVDIYKKMRPAAAAERLAVLSTDLSASILMKLPSRQAGVILNEMAPDTVAAITAIMAASSQRRDPA